MFKSKYTKRRIEKLATTRKEEIGNETIKRNCYSLFTFVFFKLEFFLSTLNSKHFFYSWTPWKLNPVTTKFEFLAPIRVNQNVNSILVFTLIWKTRNTFIFLQLLLKQMWYLSIGKRAKMARQRFLLEHVLNLKIITCQLPH